MEAHDAYTEAEGAGFVQPAAKQALGSAGGRREWSCFTTSAASWVDRHRDNTRLACALIGPYLTMD